jgi:hypothetical protein
MSDQYFVNACVRLKSTQDKLMNMCEVPEIAKGDFGKDLSSLHGEVLLTSIKELGTSKLSLVSLKIMPIGSTMKIIINVNLHVPEKREEDDEPTIHRMVNFTPGSDNVKRLKLHRLVRFMEAKAIKDHGAEFDSIVHLRIIRMEKDDIKNVSKF